jgi:diguanylate cyclase (GGDEF)-like protein
MNQSLRPQLGVMFAIVPILAVLYSIKKHGVAFKYKQVAENTFERILSQRNRRVFYSVLSIVFIMGSLSYLLLDLFINQKEIGYLIRFSGFLLLVGMIIYLLPFSSDNPRRQDFALSLLLASIMPAIYFHYNPYGYNNVIWTIPFFLIILTVIFNNWQMNIIVTASAVLSVIINFNAHGSMLVNIEKGDVLQRFAIYILLSIIIFVIGRLYHQRLNLHEMKIDQQEMLSSISYNLISVGPDNLDEKLEETLKCIGEHFGVDRVTHFEYSKDLDQIWLSGAWCGETMPSADASIVPIKASSFTWLVNEYEQNGKVVISDVNTLPREASAELEALVLKGSRSILSMPIRQNDRLLGFITLQAMMKKAEWAKDEQNLLLLVTNALADAIVKVESEKKISYMAYYDALTGLANRTYFGLQLDKMIEIARRKNKLIGVLFFDLDEFKSVNDTMGHDSGDQLLKEISNRLSQTTRKTDSVCRFGGDEFLIILPMMENIEEIESAAENMMKAFKAPTRIKEQEFFVTASCGIAVYPLDGTCSEMLIKSADMAMYEAKGNGKNSYSFWTPVMKEAVQEKMKLTNDLYRAIEQEEFILYYQPQVHIESGRIIGLEALIRWQHPERGLISPGLFIPLAEQTGLIHKMGEWVLKTACAQNKEWQEKGYDPGVMAVNLSVEQFRGNRLIEVIEKALEESGLDPKFLELEITESVAIKEPNYIVKMLRDMKALGVSISIDDFGTEYSSLSRLKELPIDRLKLAMEFVRGIDMGEKDEAIAVVIINLAKSLGMRVIAEGVEKETQLNFLKSRVCDEVQGFYFYHPMPADEVEKILTTKLT